MTLLIEVEKAIFDETGFNRCSECSNQDGTVTGCEWCGKMICVEHDFQPGDNGYDSGLVLCTDCGNQYLVRWWREASLPLSGVGEWRDPS